MRKSLLLTLTLSALFAVSCDRHPAAESNYFFTQHLPKKQKAEMKAHYAAVLNAPATTMDEKAAAGDGQSAPLFPAEGM